MPQNPSLRNPKILCSCLLAVFFASGCIGIGPSSIKSDRTQYNASIQHSNDQQLLLNLIRLKYRDTPFFLEITSIASHFKFAANGNANATLPDKGFNVFGLGGGMQVEESPTITYSPLQGEEFIQRFLAKIPLETIYLLLKSGWSIERVLRICLEKIEGVKNAPTASGPTPVRIPVYQDFLKVADLIRDMQLRGDLTVEMMMHEGFPQLTLMVDNSHGEPPELTELNTIFGLPAHNNKWVLTTAPDKDESTLTIQTRSLLGMMYYLSHAIETPRSDREKGYVTTTKTDAGTSFDWNNLTGDLLRVRSQATEPVRPAVAVPHEGNWYYIDNSDLDSKSTFSLLGQIFYLQAGASKGVAPLITIPVGG